MIKTLCPDGVEFVKLGEVCEILDCKRKPITKAKRKKGIYPYYGANGIQDYVDGFIFDGTFLLFGEDGSVINKDKSPVLNWVNGKIWVNNHAHILAERKDFAILRFLYYVLQTCDVSSIVRGTPPKINQENLRNIEIPLPPLEIQAEIVRILDKFTQLEAELEAELDCRKRQYEFYRDQLLSFDKLTPPERNNVVWMPITEVFEMRNGYTPSKNKPEFWEGGTIPWFRMEDIRQNGRILSDSIQHITMDGVKKGNLFKANSFILATTATIGEHALVIADSLANQQFTNLSVRKSLKDRVIIKFLFHYMFIIDEWCKNNTNISGFASVDMNKFKKLEIPIPSISEQNRIASILDRFEALTTSLQHGLPAEIAARRKQYEYYRDKLLDFKRKKRLNKCNESLLSNCRA